LHWTPRAFLGRIEIDSNIVECAKSLQLQKSSFAGNGGEHGAVVAMFIETCK
jgi:hypothetical protein